MPGRFWGRVQTMRPYSGRFRVRAIVFDLSLIVVAIVLVWAGVATLLQQQHAAASRNALEDTGNMALAFEENVNRTLASVDQMLLFVRTAYASDPTHFELQRWAKASHLVTDLTFQISIIDRSGFLASTSLGPVNRPVDLSDREHFHAQMNSTTDGFFISKPLIGRESGKWSVQFSRKLLDADGSFAGVVVVSMDPYWLTQFYDSINIGQGVLVLVGTDQVVRAWAPTNRQAIGFKIADVSPFALAASSNQGSYESVSEIDGIRRIFSFRKLENYPLLVAVGQDRKQVFAAFWHYLPEYLLGGAVFTSLILVISFVLVRHKLQLVFSQQAFSDTLENISQGIIMVDAYRRVPVINRRVMELLGLPAELIARMRSFDDILKWQLDQGEFGPGGDAASGFRSFVEHGGLDAHPVYERARPDGTVLEVRTNLMPDGRAVRTYTDITERKRSEAQVTFLAHHDVLTGLANRAAFHARLAQALGLATQSAGQFAVLCLDLDRFKLVNDLHGHASGDALLQQVAERLRKVIRTEDLIARLGGDEFAILQSDVRQPEAAIQLASRVVRSLADPFDIDGRSMSIGTSIGVALCPVHGHSADVLMKNADAALYRAKEGGRSMFRLFDPAMNIRVHERRLLERDLRAALNEEQFILFYQPIWDVERDQLYGFEALLRWFHPERGIIPPAEFIALAEEIGIIREIGPWVLKTACNEAIGWPARLRLCVNLSPIQFLDNDLPEQINQIAQQTGLGPHRLELEITENVLIEDAKHVSEMTQRLRAYGARIALDDFGTGYSSLSYLRHFPFDTIKIDRSFVQEVTENPTTHAVIGSLLAFGHNLGIQVIAEGVETRAQLDVLQQLRCRHIQGFLLGPPVAATELPRLIAASSLDALRVAQ